MPGQQSTSTKWYKLNGRSAKIEHGPKEDRIEYDEFVGTLLDIEYKKEESEEYGTTRRYLLKFDDGEGNLEILTVSVGTIAACNILNCLDSIDGDIGYLLIRPYIIPELNVAACHLEHEGKELEWEHEPGEYPDDDNKRTRFFHSIFEDIKEKLEEQDNKRNVGRELYEEDSEKDKEPVPAGANEPTGDLDDIDDDLPF